MKFTHADGAQAASRKSLNDGRQVAVTDGVFEVDPCPDELRDRLVEGGHEPLEEAPADTAVKDDDSEGGDQDEDEGDQEADEEIPTAGDYDEATIVDDLSYAEKQTLASQYDHISGNASSEKLTEELIKQRREEVEE